MKDETARRLLSLARETVRAAVTGEDLPSVETDDDELLSPAGAFVTLKSEKALRGCIGTFSTTVPLIETVRNMARASSTEDPRFAGQRIRAEEVDDLHIEISILHPRERIEDPLDWELGTHGIHVVSGHCSGCYLPQVAKETGWSKEEMLSSCCSHKAGLAREAWRDPGTEVYRFACDIISSPCRDR